MMEGLAPHEFRRADWGQRGVWRGEVRPPGWRLKGPVTTENGGHAPRNGASTQDMWGAAGTGGAPKDQ